MYVCPSTVSVCASRPNNELNKLGIGTELTKKCQCTSQNPLCAVIIAGVVLK